MEPILIWPYNEAPSEYQFTDNGGDEDWVAFIPNERFIPPFLDGPAFGCCCINKYEVGGGIILIGCHA